MSHKIDLKQTKHAYNTDTKTFTMSEKNIPFATEYILRNPATGNSKEFKFTHSTGPEFDPNTKWIYKSDDGITLEVCNDPKITAILEEQYLKHKMRKHA